MANKIEKMNRMRRNILLIIFSGSLIAFVAFIYPSLYRVFHLNERPRFDDSLFFGALILWLITIVFFSARYLHYRNALKKDPSVDTAVNDERVKLNWLMAYRFAFFAIIIFQVLLLAIQLMEGLFGPLYLLLPSIYLTIFLAVSSLVGAFLYRNREAKDE